ncbi:hypothetical protein MNEG_15668 [Monoraphidium neglectum]|uniref:SNF2 N-terminal domain-containing protein n=1 Tax=Monoraphidium neglectum TaxID=145388 RepID=A0A0D2MA95_9CHLO|nr:hypothetical protein MNEG_15668 [Monoraphidium neglectum]KIY92295.1 hypothetical protein MNEG_15668 [Monoraphidium neglectum]|eukprot:XP_013891315.1 hypothetical protein MNEG_15668 [Monoraphidium neglectum]
MAKACMELESQRRWVCTGTPINNSVEDLLGQFCVLDMKPLSIKSFFDAHIKAAFGGSYYADKPPLRTLLYVLQKTLIRHTKRQVIAGVQVLDLPPKSEEAVPDINKRLLQIMGLLNPLRRICSGGRLTATDLQLPEHLEAEMNPLTGIPGAAILGWAQRAGEQAPVSGPVQSASEQSNQGKEGSC